MILLSCCYDLVVLCFMCPLAGFSTVALSGPLEVEEEPVHEAFAVPSPQPTFGELL